MQAYNPIGFYLSGDGVPGSISDWWAALGAARIPFFVTVDSPGPLSAAQTAARAYPAADHTVVYRPSTAAAPSEPDYRAEPSAAATAFWAAHRAALPEGFDPDLTWLAPMTIRRAAPHTAGWLGAFAYELAQQMLSDGTKLAAFGFPPGTPPAEWWLSNEMQRFLLLCGRHPDRLGVALEEFSRQPDDIWFRRDDHVGRFFNLFAACDRARISRPTVLITAFGWTPDRLPTTTETALDGLRSVAAYYARFPQVRGAALWRITPEDAGIGWQVRRLVRPVTDWTLGPPLEVVEARPPEMGVLEEALGPPNARFVSDVTIPDDTRLPLGRAFTKTWRVRNSGGVAWTNRFTLRHTGGDRLGATDRVPLPAAGPGDVVDLSVEMVAPKVPGVVFSDWRLHDPDGVPFGDVVYCRIEATALPDPAAGVLSSRFIGDVTLPDDTEVTPGARLEKTWRLGNNGTRAWGPGVTVAFVGGNLIGPAGSPVPPAAPGEEVNVTVPVVAPGAPGVYYADYRLRDAAGNVFGELFYVRFIVPRPAGSSLVDPLSQRDPLWAARTLGEAGSTKTVGEWGCLLIVMAMAARALGKDSDPIRLQDALLVNQGFLDLHLTRWDALSLVYRDVVFGGYVPASADLLDRINASLAAGVPVPVQVDFTSDTPYTDNDQHWVLIVGRDGDDYRINDPWLLPAQEASLMERYGKAGLTLRESIVAAIFYRLAGVLRPDDGSSPEPDAERPKAGLLERGMNVNPDAPHSNPYQSDDLKGLEWVRFVFKIAARPNAAEREDITAAFAQYDPIVQAYNQMGIKCLIVLNQETVWGVGPWTGNNDWATYAGQLAGTAGQIAAHYRRYGDRVAYQVWNEGDKQNNPASVYVTPENYAEVLGRTSAALREAAPQAPVIFNGMATGPQETVVYVKRTRAALGGRLPVDALGVHPYTRWATRAPFDWGMRYGTLGDAFATYERELPGLPIWITEIGVADDNEIGPEHYPAIADYFVDVMRYIERRHTDRVPVVIWFAWSDWMRNAGFVRRDGAPKEHLFAAFRGIRNREGG
jgi:hypothetical protein